MDADDTYTVTSELDRPVDNSDFDSKQLAIVPLLLDFELFEEIRADDRGSW